MTIGGSPRNDGYSAKMLQCFTESFRQYSVKHCLSIRHYDSFRCGFAPCTDCRACRKFEGCANHDMDEFYCDFETASAIVIATPVYNMSFPAPLKAIIDRMQRYYNARFSLNKRPPIEKHRSVILLVAAGDPTEDGNVIVQQLKRLFTVTNCDLVDNVIYSGTDRIPEENFPDEKISEDIMKAANNLIQKINLYSQKSLYFNS